MRRKAAEDESRSSIMAREIAAARRGDAESLGRVLESCREYLARVAAGGLDADLAAKGGVSDLVQESLLGACRDFAAFRGQTRDELQAWLRKVMLNNLAVFRRRYRGTEKRRIAREVSSGIPEGGVWERFVSESATPVTGAMRREQSEALLAALGRLRENYRQVVIWHQYDGLTFEEIGERLDRSAEAARKLWTRALICLTEELGRAHDPRG
jgi:RNA polymerase sigma-70 factor (ECF subfamily)